MRFKKANENNCLFKYKLYIPKCMKFGLIKAVKSHFQKKHRCRYTLGWSSNNFFLIFEISQSAQHSYPAVYRTLKIFCFCVFIKYCPRTTQFFPKFLKIVILNKNRIFFKFFNSIQFFFEFKNLPIAIAWLFSSISKPKNILFLYLY